MRVRNAGAYLARFGIVFMLNGNHVVYETVEFPAGQSRVLDIPYGACCVTVISTNLVFINTWNPILVTQFDQPTQKCYVVFGTTLSPGWHEESC